MRIVRKTIISIFLVSLFLLAACLPFEEEVLPPPNIAAVQVQRYRTVAASRGDVLLYRYCSVVLAPSKEEELSFSLSDQHITSVYAQEGDLVREGDIIAELDRGYFLDELAKTDRDETWAELQLKQLSERYELDRSHARTSGIPVDTTSYEAQMDAIATQLEILKIRRAYLQNEDDRRVMHSPMDGIVTYMMANMEGSMTVADQLVVTIADPSKQVFVLRGDDAGLVGTGDLLELSSSGVTYAARVADQEELGISRVVDASEKYIVLVDESIVLTEKNASVNVIIEKSEDTIFIPRTVINRAGARVFVYVLIDGIRMIRDVEIGLEGSMEVEILSGLSEGELVIVS